MDWPRLCTDGLIGIGRGANPKNLQTRYCRQAVAIDPSEEGVWVIPAFELAPVETPSTGGSGANKTAPAARKTGTPGMLSSSSGR